MAQQGSIPTGPSDSYLRLLKGEITPEEYAKSVEKRVREPKRDAPKSSGSQGTQPKRA